MSCLSDRLLSRLLQDIVPVGLVVVGSHQVSPRILVMRLNALVSRPQTRTRLLGDEVICTEYLRHQQVKLNSHIQREPDGISGRIEVCACYIVRSKI